MWYVWQGNDRVSHSTPKKWVSCDRFDWLFLSFLSFIFLFTYASLYRMNEWMKLFVKVKLLTRPPNLVLPACLLAWLPRASSFFRMVVCKGGGARHNMKHTASMWHVRRERERSRGQIRKNFAAQGERWGRYCQRKKTSPHFARRLILVWNSKIWSGLVPSASRSSIRLSRLVTSRHASRTVPP